MNEVCMLDTIYIYLTWDCNLRCKHCWVSAGHDRETIQLPPSALKEFVSQATRLGANHIRFTGGEPLLCWDRIVAVVEETGDKADYSIETNGLLLNKEKVAYMIAHNFRISISLHGDTAANHDSFTDIPGSFNKVVSIIQRIVADYGNIIDLQIITCIQKSNLNELPKRLAFFDSLGVTNVKINPVVLEGRAKNMAQANESVLLDKEDYEYVNREIIRFLSNNPDRHVLFQEPMCLRPYSLIKNGDYGLCGIKSLLSILPDGRLSLCGYGTIDDRVIVCEWNENSNLNDIWSNNKVLLELRNEVLEGACEACIHLSHCMGDCRIASFCEYGKWGMPMPLCQKLWEMGSFPISRTKRAQ